MGKYRYFSGIRIKERIILITFGLFLSIVLLELLLRVGGSAILSLQEYENRIAMKQKGTYRILCLGDSFTLHGYPADLARILNERISNIIFTVINKGEPGATSESIVLKLEENLKKYNPDMVIVMIGLNDRMNIVPYTDTIVMKIIYFIETFKTYKLAKYLWANIVHMIRDSGIYKSKAKRVNINNNVESGLGRLYNYKELEKMFKKAIEVGPENERAYIGLGWCYREQMRFKEAEEMFKKAIEVGPENDWATIGIGRFFYREHGKDEVSEGMFKKAIEIVPKESWAYIGLGRFYIEQMRFKEAEEMFRKAIEIDHKNERSYIGLGWCYREQMRFKEAEEMFKNIIELNPKEYLGYITLGEFYIEQQKFKEAEEMFKKVIEIDPGNIRAYGGLAFSYQERNEYESAEKYFTKANRLRLQNFNPTTRLNYQKLKEILNRRQILLICLQYPACSIEPLKKIFDTQEGIIFVDNEMTFKKAIKEEGYNEYFRDNCGGDFGHYTQKGRELLAENIADVILKDILIDRKQR